jgi:hypothetical protein
MKATVSGVMRSLRAIEQSLRDLDFLYDGNECVAQSIGKGVTRVTWATTGVRPDLMSYANSSIDEYLEFLKGRHFNFMLMDGAFIQLSYDVKGADEICGCRVVWYPCPIDFDLEDLEHEPLDTLILTTPTGRLSCRAPLRVDFAPDAATADHPATHMHAGVENFRLPLQRAVEPGRFIRLIFRTVYPALWRGKAELFQCEDWKASDNLTTEDKSVGFLGWNQFSMP